MRLAGSFVVVTGASSGIGREIALSLATHDARLLLVGRDRGRLDDVAAKTGGEVVVADLADQASTAALAHRLQTSDPPVDVLVNNAGVGTPDLDLLLAVDLRAPVILSQAVVPGMARRGRGHLVFVTSIAGRLGVAGESEYAAVKAGLHVYAASQRLELAARGVGVTSIVPGVVRTEFFERRGEPYTRSFPRPISAGRVAAATVRAIERDRAEVCVPGWLRVPIALQGLAPTAYTRMTQRWART